MFLARSRNSLLSFLKKYPNFHSLSAVASAWPSPPTTPASSGGHWPLQQYLQQLGICTSRRLLADSDATLISSPLTPLIGPGTRNAEGQAAISKPEKVQAMLKGIKQSPKKLHLVATVVRGMRVEDALLQMQVTVKRAAKIVHQICYLLRGF